VALDPDWQLAAPSSLGEMAWQGRGWRGSRRPDGDSSLLKVYFSDRTGLIGHLTIIGPNNHVI